MEYNGYYLAPSGPSLPLLQATTTMMNQQYHRQQHHHHQQLDSSLYGPSMISSMSNHNALYPATTPAQAPLGMRQAPGLSPMQSHHQHHSTPPHQHIQQQQHISSHTPNLQQQSSPHPHYHQQNQSHPLPPHSASPHPSTTPHQPQQPPSRPSTGPSPMHHLQSPVHMNGPSPKLHSMPSGLSQPQHHHHHIQHHSQSNQTNQQHVGSSISGHSQTGGPSLLIQTHSHNQSNFNNTSANLISPHSSPHYTPSPSSSHHQQNQISSQHHHNVPSRHQISRAPSTHNLSNVSHMPTFYQNLFQTEIRIIELNERLQNRPRIRVSNPLPSVASSEETNWWERFASDFFDNDSTLSIKMPGREKPIEYIISRTLVPRFFRSYFDGGVVDFSIKLRNSKETSNSQRNLLILNCDKTDITTKNVLKNSMANLPMNVIVHTEGHLTIEFWNDGSDNLLIRSWRFKVNSCREYIDRSYASMGLPNSVLVEPSTYQGLPSATMFFLKMCSIMEPMQEIMTQHKLTNLEARSCLKQFLFEKYRFSNEDDGKKRRKRKQPAQTAPKSAMNPKKTKVPLNCNNVKSATISPTPLPPVSIVGEPSLMGDYKDGNERLIIKIENADHIPLDEPKSDGEKSTELEANNGAVIDNGKVLALDENSLKEEAPKVQNDSSSPDTSDRESIKQVSAENSVALEDPVLTAPVEETVSEEPSEKENNSTGLNGETQTDSTGTQSEGHYNIMTSIPEDDTCKSTSCDSLVSKLPPSSNNKSITPTNGSSNKQNRRRSAERKETLREGLMRTSDFVVAMKDLKCEHPALWRITTGNNLLQQFEPKSQSGVVLYENTNQYAGWNPEIKRDYVGVDVRLTQHTRNQITVERLLLNFQKLEDADAFYDKHFAIYLQTLISIALDSKFWDSIENEPKHHDYFVTSRKIIDDTMKRYKLKLANKLKLTDSMMKSIEKYPNLLIKPLAKDEKMTTCRACNINSSTQTITFENRSYDLHSYKPVKVTNEPNKSEDRDQQNHFCDSCLEIVKLYSEIHHMGWKFFNLSREKVENHRIKGKPINTILDECMKDQEWLVKMYAERDMLWSKIDSDQ